MSTRAEQTKPTTRELADLSALADGSLDPSRRAAVEARIAASPDLSVLYERERRAVAALHQARATERAPASLRARIDAARPNRTVVVRRRMAYGAAVATALAAAALAVVLALPGGTPGAPSVSDAAALAARGPDQAAPSPDPSRPGARLEQNVGEVYFPNWAQSLGWRAVGARNDDLGGHRAVTVYYQGNGKRVAYTIVAAPPLARPAGQRSWMDKTELRTFTADGRVVVAWREAGDTCILSASGVSAAELQKLAAWSPQAKGR